MKRRELEPQPEGRAGKPSATRTAYAAKRRTRLALALAIAWASAAPARGAELNVLASFLPMYVFTKNVVGTRPGIAVDLMLPAALGCPHDYSLSPGDMKKIAAADLLVVNGMGMEGFLGETLHKVSPKLKIVDSSAGFDPVRSGEAEDHGRNPHVWVSPRRAAAQVRTIAKALSEADPEGAAQYGRNADEYAARLDALAAKLEAVVRASANRRVIEFHDIFDYLAADTGLEIAGVIEETAGQAPSPRGLARLAELARKTRPAAILTEPQYPDDLARILQHETGVPIFRLDPFATGTGDADGYGKAMEKNLEVLREALGGGKP